MNRNILTHVIREDKQDEHIIKKILKPDIIVQSGISELDRLLGGFKSGELTFINGDSEIISYLPNQLCVNTYRTFHSDTIYIDGGMSADPYRISKCAKMMELNQREILDHVHICRGFNVYQLSTIIHETLEPLIQKCRPKTLIIGMLPLLYLDSDVSYNESKKLLKNNLHKIKILTKKYDIATIFTNQDKTLLSNHVTLRKIIYSDVDEIVRMRQLNQCIHIDLLKRKYDATIVRFAMGQLRLDDFGLVIS